VLRQLSEILRHLRRGGGVVNQNGGRGHGVECAIGARADLAQVIVIADAGDHQLGIFGGFCGCMGQRPAMLRDKSLGFGVSAVVNRHLMPGPDKVRGHGRTHGAQSDVGDALRWDGVVGFGGNHRCPYGAQR
jgi:hypothetical protein